MRKKVYMYPLWLRLWHWLNAILFIALILSGLSLHYSASTPFLMPFKAAIMIHNACGIFLSGVFLFYTIFNIATKNYKQYIPRKGGFIWKIKTQAIYYLYGIFKGEPHPFETDVNNKFNPLQQVTYFAIIFFMCPMIIISGILLLFPSLAPDKVMGMGGVWPIAVLHALVGFFLSLFLIGHVYLAMLGETPLSGIKSMITGWHNEEIHEEEQTANDGSEEIIK